MNIIQTKDLQSNNCNVKAWLQNELVVETSYTCRAFNEGLSLFTAGDYNRILNGQIRKFSFVNTIPIARNKLHSALGDYSDNFEVSFEYQALTVPQSSDGWHQILEGKLTFFLLSINNRCYGKVQIKSISK